MKIVSREQLIDRIQHERGLTVIEVLQPESYRQLHLPGAINVPMDENFDLHIRLAVPDKHHPVVLYCRDRTCKASPAVARHMEELGYESVLEYEGGKADWKQAGLPVESDETVRDD
jgi:rhodanese-related sulfurtransferase